MKMKRMTDDLREGDFVEEPSSEPGKSSTFYRVQKVEFDELGNPVIAVELLDGPPKSGFRRLARFWK